MSKESYARGFCKAAAAAGVDPVALAKFAAPLNSDSRNGLVFDPKRGRYVVDRSRRGQELLSGEFASGIARAIPQKPVDITPKPAFGDFSHFPYTSVTNDTGVYRVPTNGAGTDYLKSTRGIANLSRDYIDTLSGGAASVTNSPNATFGRRGRGSRGFVQYPIWKEHTGKDGAKVHIPASRDSASLLRSLAERKAPDAD